VHHVGSFVWLYVCVIMQVYTTYVSMYIGVFV